MTVKVTLSKPIQAHGETIAELSLRPPNGGDIRRTGAPFRVDTLADGTERADFNTSAMAALIVRLANIPPNSVDELDARDFIRLMNVIAGFFGEASPEKSSTDTSSSPGSTAEIGSGK